MYTYLKDNFMHSVKITQILDHISVVTIHMHDSHGGMATLSHHGTHWPLLAPQQVPTKTDILHQVSCTLLPCGHTHSHCMKGERQDSIGTEGCV